LLRYNQKVTDDMEVLENAGPVNILLVVPDSGTSTNIYSILRNIGFGNVTIIKSLELLKAHLKDSVPDMIICSAEFPQGDSCELIRDLRMSDVGSNPFIPVITVTADTSKEFVNKIISTGTDALIVMPFSAQQLYDRIQGVIESRKQFVATSDYLGLDRRPGSRGKSDMEITKFDVPNTLRAKITGEEDPEEIGLAVRSMMDQMVLCRLDRQSDQIVMLVKQIAEDCSIGTVPESAMSSIETLQDVAKDVINRMNGTSYEHVSGLCESLQQVSFDILSSEGDTLDKNAQLLTQLSLAIQVGFTSSQSADAALKIADTIGH